MAQRDSLVTDASTRLSTLRLVCFVPHARDAVHVGLLTPDAARVIDLAHLGINDIFEALDQLIMLRRAAGAILHGAAGTSFGIGDVHLVASMPLARSVVAGASDAAPHFADPATVHGPGGHLTRTEAAAARVGLAVVVGEIVDAGADGSHDQLERALIGSVIVLGLPQEGFGLERVLRVGAVGPFLAVPVREPESVTLTRVAPIGVEDDRDARRTFRAPDASQFRALARTALRTHALRPGDLLTIFPAQPDGPAVESMPAGSWVRASASGLGTLSLAVR